MNRLPVVLITFLLGSTHLTQAKNASTRFHFEYQNGVPYVQVISPQGRFRPMRFILDTGASPTIFNHLTASRLDVEKFGRSGNCGDASAIYVRQVHATCGGISLKRVALSSDMIDISLGCGRWVDGLLGTDYFRDKIVTIDFKNHILDIQEPESPGMLATLFNEIPFSDRHDSVFVNIQSPGSKRPLLFLLDTGSTRTFIDTKLAKQLGIDLQTTGRKVHTVGGNMIAYESKNFVGTCKGYAMPSKIYANSMSKLSWEYSRRIDGILGTDFLHAYTVHIDFRTRQVNFD